ARSSCAHDGFPTISAFDPGINPPSGNLSSCRAIRFARSLPRGELMIPRVSLLVSLVAAFLVVSVSAPPAPGCCPAGKYRKGDRVGAYPVVNADQAVIIIWDAAAKVQHFIRRASFKAEGDDFGFIIPSPQQPTLDESGNEAFPYLFKVTEPETIKRKAPSG